MSVRILTGDWVEQMRTLPDASVQMIGPTSPPYLGLRDYGASGQVGQEASPDEFVAVMVAGFREARRVLRPDGVFVLNLGDSYAGSGKGPTGHNGIGDQGKRQGFVNDRRSGRGIRSGTGYELQDRGAVPGLKPKDLMMVPFRVALALQADGWWLRSVIPWVKRNGMPESVQDRPSSGVEYLFLLTKSARYYWDGTAIRQPWADDRQGRDSARVGSVRNVGGRADGFTKPNGVDPSANGGRSFRNSDPFLATWQGLWCDDDDDPLALLVNPQPFSGAHFATFSPRLVEPFIKAGTSEKGCCPACGSPWARIVERREVTRTPKERAGRGYLAGMVDQDNWASGTPTHSGLASSTYQRAVTTGWSQSCQCPPAEPRPCVVLDPFLGSGTTLLVADRLGRDGVGCELNPEYAEMARRRIANDAGPLLGTRVSVEAPVQLDMLEDAG